MNIPLVFVAFVVSVLTIYMMHRFVKRPGFLTAPVLLIQFLSASVLIFALIENVLTVPEVELAVIAGGVFLPSCIVVYDHIKVLQKRKKTGLSVSLIEPRKKKDLKKLSHSYYIENADLGNTEIKAEEFFDSLGISDREFSRNIKKQLSAAHKLISLKKYEAAAIQYRFLYSFFPESAYIAYNAGYLHCLTGKYREAIKILKNARKLMKQYQRENSGNTPVRNERFEAMIEFGLGYALYSLGKYEQAITHFSKVIETDPNFTAAYKNIARAYLALDMEDAAVEYLEKGRKDFNDSLLRIVLGSIYYKKGETGKALEVLDEITAAEAKRIETLKLKGKAALKEKMFDRAEECFRKLLELEPEEPLNYYHLAVAQRELNRSHDALKTYEKGLAVNPGNSMLLFNAAVLLDETGDRERAVRYLYKSLDDEEKSEEAFNYLGVLLGQMGRFHESVQVFDRGIREFKNSYLLYFNRGIVLEMSKRYEDAADSFERAYDLNKNDQELIYHYAAVLIKLRRFDKALKIYRNSLSSYPDDAELYYGLSVVYAMMGEKDMAVELLKKVIETDPSYKSRIKSDSNFRILDRHDGYRALIA